MAEVTEDYKIFKILKGNRELSKGHLTRLMQSIAAYPQLLPTRPILVNEKMEVIDGQHRLEACKQLGLPVYYEMAKNLSTESAAIINRNQRNWVLIDYVQSFAAEGNRDYQKLLEVKEEYPTITDTVLFEYISAFRASGPRIRNGSLKVRGDLDEARDQLDRLLDLQEISSAFKRTTVARAFRTIMDSPEYNHDRMMTKFGQYGESFNPFGTQATLLREIERIYNFNSKTTPVHLY